ncbi:trypsin-like serine peptidase [Pseudomonas cucumis]|uniref:trypsin-like serine peptidase n=1 Tax=Pseudomonas cucumis TaxID=2954082 RepID=UPI002733C6EA|nr:trypsin-like serine protease [Pseudomonas cucumis]WLG90801.1 trypsin-like serine protease [Pseudomonas cucumis]
MKFKHITLIINLISHFFLFAEAAQTDIGDNLKNGSPAKPLTNSDNRYSRWTGIGLLNMPKGTCTAALIDTRDSGWTNTAPAYVITAGHCVLAEYGTSKLNHKFNANVTFNYFQDTVSNHKTYKVHTAIWTSMLGTDLAVLELEKPLSALLQDQIMPLKISPTPPFFSHDVLNVGAPGTFTTKTLRLSACTQEVSRTISGIPPAFPGGLVNECKDLDYGSSGSPMVDRRTNQITSIVSERQYGFSPAFLSSCFINGIFSNGTATCDLQQINVNVDFESLFLRTKLRPEMDYLGNETMPTWNFSFNIDTPYYRYKAVRDALNCEKPENYSAAISATNGHINDSVGPETRMHVLCIIGVRSKEQKLTTLLLKNTFTHAAHLAEPAPEPAFGHTKNFTSMQWEGAYPDFSSHFFYSTSIDSTPCADVRDERYKKAAEFELLPPDSPLKVCSYASNESDLQPSATRFDLVTPPTRAR